MKVVKMDLTEMARVGFTSDNVFEVYVHTDDSGKIPHFHVWDAETKGDKFHTCIRIDSPAYFHHTGKEGVLNSKEKKNLVQFLKSSCKNKKFDTNWELLVFMWNLNNSDVEIDSMQEMPDYLKLH